MALEKLTAGDLKRKPQKKEFTLSDGGGLYLRYRPNGEKEFYFEKMMNGEKIKMGIGNYPDISLSTARKRASEYRNDIAKGINPKRKRDEQRKADANNPTYGELIQIYFKDVLLTHYKSETIAETALGRLRNLPVNHKVRIKDITARDLIEALRKREKKAHRVAELTISDLKGLFRYAIHEDLVDYSPAESLNKKFTFKTKREKRDSRPLSKTEIKSFLEKIDTVPFSRSIQLVLKLMLFNGRRPIEITGAKKEEFNFQDMVWRIPKERMKNNREYATPITDTMKKIIDELFDISDTAQANSKKGGKSVFLVRSPNSYITDRPIEVRSLSRALKRHNSHFNLDPKKDDMIPYDLRHTFRTSASDVGGLSKEIKRVLMAHLVGDLEDIYDGSDLLPEKKNALLKIESFYMAALNSEKVISLDKRRA